MAFSRLSKASVIVRLGWFLAGAGGAAIAVANVIFDPGGASHTTRAFVNVAFGTAQLGLGLAAAAGVYRLYGHAQRIAGKRIGKDK